MNVAAADDRLWYVSCDEFRRVMGLNLPRPEITALFSDLQSTDPIGTVTSGGFGPSVNTPVAMGYVKTSSAKSADPIYAELRGERVPVRLAPLPFVDPKYKR